MLTILLYIAIVYVVSCILMFLVGLWFNYLNNKGRNCGPEFPLPLVFIPLSNTIMPFILLIAIVIALTPLQRICDWYENVGKYDR